VLAAGVLTPVQPAAADLSFAEEVVSANLATVRPARMDPASAIPLKVILATANPAATVGNANAVCVTVNQATSEPAQELRCLRPWGWYEVLAVGEGYQVKRLHLEPNQRFSLQLHHHRSEQWLVLNARGSCSLVKTASRCSWANCWRCRSPASIAPAPVHRV
jgi:hypothetical protein